MLAVVFIALRRSWSSVAVSAILALLWVWLGAAYHLAFFARINPVAYGFGTLSIIGGLLFAWQGVIHRRIEFVFDKREVPIRWSLVGSQAAFLLDVKPDFGLLVAGAAAVVLFIWPARIRETSPTSL